MNITEAIFYGILQGLTEFLPISSSGHLAVLNIFLTLDGNAVPFFVILHIGTLFAIFAYFRKEIVDIVYGTMKWVLSGGNSDGDAVFAKMSAYLIVATMATIMIALPARHYIEQSFHSLLLISVNFLITGSLLCVAHFASMRWGRTALDFRRSIWIGLIQGIGTFPGISRSGATISAGILVGVDGVTSTRFSFLLAIPAIIGAGILELRGEHLTGMHHLLIYAMGFLTAFLSGLLAIKLLLKIVTLQRLYYFGFYCFLMGSSLLVYELVK